MMQLDIISTERVIFSGNVCYVNIPLVDGSTGILPGHSPLISYTKPGNIEITDSIGKKETIAISHSGIAEIQPKRISILINKE